MFVLYQERNNRPTFTFSRVEIYSMPETLEHRMIRSKAQQSTDNHSAERADDAPHQQHTAPTLLKRINCEPVTLPAFLFEVNARVSCNGRRQ